jgi:hypothetical protein
VLEIVGYSMPPDDIEVRRLLRAGAQRGGGPSRILVRNPAPDVCFFWRLDRPSIEGDGMRRPHRVWAATRYSLVVAIAVTVAACGGDPAGGGSREGPAVSPKTGTAGNDSDTPTDREVEALPAGGPVDEIVPPGDPAYQDLAAGRCQKLKDDVAGWGPDVVGAETADTVELYRSAAHVCLGEWDVATAAFGRIGSPPDLEGLCARAAVYDWLQRLIRAHQADPQFTPRFVPSGQPNPCPTESPTGAPDDEEETGVEDEPTGDDETGVEDEPTGDETTDEGAS